MAAVQNLTAYMWQFELVRVKHNDQPSIQPKVVRELARSTPGQCQQSWTYFYAYLATSFIAMPETTTGTPPLPTERWPGLVALGSGELAMYQD